MAKRKSSRSSKKSRSIVRVGIDRASSGGLPSIWSRKSAVLIGVTLTTLVGLIIIQSRASGVPGLFEADTASLSGAATVGVDGNAGGGKYVTLNPASTSGSTCATSGAVPINTTDNAQNIVNGRTAGTVYVVKAGVHQTNFAVVPKSGDKYCGEAGAIVDGGRSLAHAFSGGATNVTIDSITMQNYNPGIQRGAINPAVNASGWTLRNVNAIKNMYWGINVANNMKVLGGHFNENEQGGIGGSYFGHATGVVLDGLDADPATYDGPEMGFNKVLHQSCDWEGGGLKFDVSNTVIRNAWIHDNDCMGIWYDINAVKNLVEYNKIHNNAAEGIFYEISQDACIRHNIVSENGKRYRSGWWWSAGIGNAASFNVEVYGNTLTNNFNGIVGIQQTRTDSTPPAHLVDHYYVHNNTVSGSGQNGLGTDNGTNYGTRDVVYANNTFTNGAQSFTKSGTGYTACANLGFADGNPYPNGAPGGGSTTPAGTATSSVNIPTTGTYKVWARVMAPDSTANSFTLQLDGGNATTFGDVAITPNVWTWVDYTGGNTTNKFTASLNSGDHNVKLTGREAGVKVDRLVFTMDTSCVPTGIGDNCLPQTQPPADTTLPTVSLSAPATGATVSGTVNVTADASDNVGITKVDFGVDTGLASTDTTSPYGFSWNTANVANGVHDLSAKAYDAAGNSKSVNISVTVNNVSSPPPVPVGNGNGLLGSYFNEMDFTAPVLTRTDANVNFNWGIGSPASGVDVDTFSVRWTGQVQAQKTETYTFHTAADDGVRLWVNDQLLIDNWNDHSVTEDTGSIALVAGQKYNIKLEFYDNGIDAVAELYWSSPTTTKAVIPTSQLYAAVVTPSSGDGLRAAYFDNSNFSGTKVERIDRTVNFNWGKGAPVAGILSNTFSVRWTGKVEVPTSGNYTFYTQSDDGARLWVNGQQLVNNWTQHSSTENRGTISLSPGQKYDVKLEYFENQGNALMQFRWSGPNVAKQIVPQSVLFSQ